MGKEPLPTDSNNYDLVNSIKALDALLLATTRTRDRVTMEDEFGQNPLDGCIEIIRRCKHSALAEYGRFMFDDGKTFTQLVKTDKRAH